MIEAHERVVEAQFGPQARAYVESAVHSQGADLDAIGALAKKRTPSWPSISAPAGAMSHMLLRAMLVGSLPRICRPRCWQRWRRRRARRA